jgi:hypothetical protein
VGCGILPRLAEIVGTGQHLFVSDEHRADGNFSDLESPAGGVHGQPHVL